MLDLSTVSLSGSRVEPLRIASVAAPVLPLEAVRACWPRDEAMFWAPRSGSGVVTTGVAHRLRASGPARMDSIRDAGAHLLKRLAAQVPQGAPVPRLWGGFSFAPGAASCDAWNEFGDAGFVLPALSYSSDGRRAWLQCIGLGSPADVEARAGEALALLQRGALAAGAFAASATAGAPAATSCGRVRLEGLPDTDDWKARIDAILQAIADGRVRKVVAALSATVAFDHPLSPERVIANLRAETGPVFRFAIGRGNSTFVGATPELLVRRQGDSVRSEALAGTLARANGGPQDLMASEKDRDEHAFVRDALIAVLGPLCRELDVPEVPTVRELRVLYHLLTPVRGLLHTPVHVLDLVERLHPTPATCGTPRDVALKMILADESFPRGWYASPVGWFDAAGDGEFVVALRSALMTSRGARVYAGAGIVSGSRAEHELLEVQLKQRAILRALGFDDK